MARLPRPHIPLSVRIRVIERQCLEAGITPLGTHNAIHKQRSLSERLAFNIREHFGDKKVELHHRPALVNRLRKSNGEYDPPANDPDHLIYLLETDHDIETRVRGLHGQHSDLALARKRKRKERKAKRPKRKWASRPLRSANRWPKRKQAQTGG
jgi:hypothetical protein